MAHVPTSLNNSEPEVDDLDADKLKTVFLYLKHLSDLVDKQVLKKTKFNKLKTKVNKVNKKVYDATTLIGIN